MSKLLQVVDKIVAGRGSYLLIFGLVVAAYSNTLSVPFLFDDNRNIVNYQRLKELDTIRPLFQFRTDDMFINRFVGYLTFNINYRLHGLEVMGFHLTNLAIHLGATSLLFAIIQLLLARLRPRGIIEKNSATGSGGERKFALAVALLFALHPVQTQAVTYIVQRFAALAALFLLLSLWSYLKFRTTESRGRRIFYYLAMLVSGYLALKSKETAYTLPFFIIACELLFFSGAIKRRLLHLSGALLLLLPIVLGLLSPGGDGGGVAFDVDSVTRVQSKLERHIYLITQFRMIVTYLRLLIFPFNQALIYDVDPIYSLSEPAALLSLLLLLALASLGVWAYLKSRQSEELRAYYLLLSFGILWFFLALSIESSIFPIGRLIFEHRLYLPSMGAVLAALAGGALVTRGIVTHTPCLRLVALGCAILLLLATTFVRNQTWGSLETFWGDVIQKNPHYGGAYNDLAVHYHKKGELERSRALFEEGIARIKIRSYTVDPSQDLAQLHGNLARLQLERGEMGEVEKNLVRAQRLTPNRSQTNLDLADYYLANHRLDEALSLYRRALELEPDSYKILITIGDAYLLSKNFEEALNHFRRATELDPRAPLAFSRIGYYYRLTGESQKAAEYFNYARSKSSEIKRAD